MINSILFESNPSIERVGIIECSGGNGLLITADIIREKVARAWSSVSFVRLDLLTLIPVVGRLGVCRWNEAMAAGNGTRLERLAQYQKIFDYLVNYLITFRVHKWLQEHRITTLISTQPLGASAIFSAAHSAGISRVHVVLADAPTLECRHFLDPLMQLHRDAKDMLELISDPPVAGFDADFWARSTIDVSRVHYTELVRDPFLDPTNRPSSEENFPIALTGVASPIEISASDFVLMITLGSQVSPSDTLAYVRQIALLAQSRKTSERTMHLFVLCGTKLPELLESIASVIAPSFLQIKALGFQDVVSMARLMMRSDAMISRGGGATLREASACRRYGRLRRLLIHAPGGTIYPSWEAGNARFYGGEFTEPSSLPPDLF